MKEREAKRLLAPSLSPPAPRGPCHPSPRSTSPRPAHTSLRCLEQAVAVLPSLTETLLPSQPGDVLEMDELVSSVGEKWFKRWLWTPLCRRTRRIVAYAIGDRSQDTCPLLWQAVLGS